MADQIRKQLRPLDDINRSFGKLKSSLAPLAPYANVVFKGVAVAAAGAAAVAAASLAGIGVGLKRAMDTENLRVSFKVLLGDAQAAAAMVSQLEEFSDEAPFEMSSIVNAGKQLLAFGVAASEVKPLLRDLGDLAAAMDKPLDQVADTFGRLKSGQFGQAFQNLRSMGITQVDLQAQGLEFDRGGKFVGDADAAMDAVRAIIKTKFGGTMKELSETTSSQFLGLKEQVGKFLEEFSKPINDQLGPLLERASNWVKSLIPTAKAAGEYVVASFAVISEVFEEGNLPSLALSGLKYAFGEAANFLARFLNAALGALAQSWVQHVKNVISMLSIVTQADFWKGMGAALLGIAAQFGYKLMEYIAGFLERLDFIPGVGSKMKGAAENIRSFAAANKGDAAEVTATGVDLLKPYLHTYQSRVKETFAEVAATFNDTWNRTSDLFDASASKAQLVAMRERIKEIADPAIAERLKKLEVPDTTGKIRALDADDKSDKKGPSASRLASIGGLGVFVKDPLLAESRRQSQLLEKIAKNTEQKEKPQAASPFPLTPLRFT